jgi:Flp pilus assembly protein TadG
MKKRDDRRQGTAAVEFALLLPVMALMIMLLVEGANAMHTYSALVEASREGARHVLMQGDEADVEALVDALVTEINAEDLSTNVVKDPVANTITVEVSYDYRPFGSENGATLLGGEDESFQIVAQTTMPMP